MLIEQLKLTKEKNNIKWIKVYEIIIIEFVSYFGDFTHILKTATRPKLSSEKWFIPKKEQMCTFTLTNATNEFE